MLENIVPMAIGAAGVAVAYFTYLAATKGLPAAIAWVKAKWNAGKAELAALEAEITDAKAKLNTLEQNTVAELKAGLAAVQADVTALKAKAASSAPAFLTPVAPAAGAPAA